MFLYTSSLARTSFLILPIIVVLGQDSTMPGIGIPLVKRAHVYTLDEQTGARVANLPALRQHVSDIRAKYKQGMSNWQLNTGELDLWPVAADFKSGTEDKGYEDALDTILGSFAADIGADKAETDADPITAIVSNSPKVFNQTNVRNQFPILSTHLPAMYTSQPASTATAPTYRSRERRGKRLKTRQSEPLVPVQNGLLWVGAVSIGSNNQTFLIDMDTGSADFWVPSVECRSEQCSKHRKYDPDASSTSQFQSDQTFRITYGDGAKSSGPVYTDSVTMAGITAEQQYFSPVTSVSETFSKDPEDGILGMAFQTISELNQPPWFQNAFSQGKVQSAVFSFRLAKTGSELYLGGVNPSKFTGAIEWHPITSKSYWLIAGQPSINGKPYGSKPFNMAIDSGTTVIVAPTADAKSFWRSVPGAAPYSAAAGYWTFPCKSPPSISFTFTNSNKAWTIAPQDFNLGQTASNSPNCVGAIIGQDVGVNAWIMGDAFMKNVYSVFDLEQSRIGFAQPK